MAAPIGNNYAKKGRLFERSLLSAIREDDGAGLLAAARQLYRKAAKGDMVALGMLADRLDGKVPNQSDQSDGGDVRTLTLSDLARIIMASRSLGEPAQTIEPTELIANDNVNAHSPPADPHPIPLDKSTGGEY